MKCEPGLCLICEKEIVKTCTSCGVKSWSSEHTEIQVDWSNKSKMRVAVCLECSKKKFSPEDKKEMTEAHFAVWDKLGSKYDKEIVIV